jgi:hypothetical protein
MGFEPTTPTLARLCSTRTAPVLAKWQAPPRALSQCPPWPRGQRDAAAKGASGACRSHPRHHQPRTRCRNRGPSSSAFWRSRPALDLAMPSSAATARTVMPRRNRAAASSRWVGFRSHANQVSPLPSGVEVRLASNGRPASPKWARLFSTWTSNLAPWRFVAFRPLQTDDRVEDVFAAGCPPLLPALAGMVHQQHSDAPPR